MKRYILPVNTKVFRLRAAWPQYWEEILSTREAIFTDEDLHSVQIDEGGWLYFVVPDSDWPEIEVLVRDLIIKETEELEK